MRDGILGTNGLMERVNFAVNQFNDLETPGFMEMINRLGNSVKGSELLDRCLDLVGQFDIGDETRESLCRYADAVGDIDLSSDQAKSENAVKVARMIQLIVSTREYQFA